jgi:hypothetical protein
MIFDSFMWRFCCESESVVLVQQTPICLVLVRAFTLLLLTGFIVYSVKGMLVCELHQGFCFYNGVDVEQNF